MSKFELQPLNYQSNALEPVIGQRTIEIHHGKHLQAYVNNLNAALETNDKFNGMSVDDIYLNSEGGIRNNAGQIINHNLYFEQFKSPVADNKPNGKIAKLIEKQFGSFDAFKAEFVKQGTTLFGSGWVWLSLDKDGKLVITQETNAAVPTAKGLKPLLTFDVWEHAYYLDYQNRRADYLNTLWQIVDWDVVNGRL